MNKIGDILKRLREGWTSLREPQVYGYPKGRRCLPGRESYGKSEGMTFQDTSMIS